MRIKALLTISIMMASVSAQAASVTSAKPAGKLSTRVAPPSSEEEESPWSASIIQKVLRGAKPSKRLIRWEGELSYSFNPEWSVTIGSAYTQPTEQSNLAAADADDLEVSVQYSIFPESMQPQFDGKINLAGILPTSRTAYQVSETGGVGIGGMLSYTQGYFRVRGLSNIYKLFYKDNFGDLERVEPTPEADSEIEGFDLPVDTSPQFNHNANVEWAHEHVVNLILNPNGMFKARYLTAIEYIGKFDGTETQILHQAPGVGLTWSKYLTTWYAVDAAKNFKKSGSIFESQNLTHQFLPFLNF